MKYPSQNRGEPEKTRKKKNVFLGRFFGVMYICFTFSLPDPGHSTDDFHSLKTCVQRAASCGCKCVGIDVGCFLLYGTSYTPSVFLFENAPLLVGGTVLYPSVEHYLLPSTAASDPFLSFFLRYAWEGGRYGRYQELDTNGVVQQAQRPRRQFPPGESYFKLFVVLFDRRSHRVLKKEASRTAIRRVKRCYWRSCAGVVSL